MCGVGSIPGLCRKKGIKKKELNQMKYPKVLQMLALATAITVAAPSVTMPAYASETAETPQEYTERTGYVLPEGFHYILDGEYIILDEEGMPVIEADPSPEEPEAPSEDAAAPEEPGNTDSTDVSGETGGQGNPEDTGAGEDAETPGDSMAEEDPEDTEDPEVPGEGEESEIPGEEQEPVIPGDEETPDSTEKPGDEDTSDKAEDTDSSEGTEIEDQIPEEEQPSDEGEDQGIEGSNGGETAVLPGAEEMAADSGAQEEVSLAGAEEMEESFLTSAQFKAVRDRIQYNVEVPIEGLPTFITQEMIVGALKAQDETGYPASVTIAQIIQESGYGKYGPGGEDGKGLSYLAFEYCNLFGIKGVGTAGSVSMKTSEMEANGRLYSTYAGFRMYNTYTECIEDRTKLLEEVYSDLTKDVKDANTFAMKIGRRWATDLQYGKHLIRTMTKYDLYRLDDLTLNEFSDMIGDFANPCPGGAITSLFGRRTAPIKGATTYHRGLDLGTGAYNIPTYAVKAGTVVFAGEAGACGNLITIDHGDGMVTKYMHHSEIYVEEGQEVEKGQQIGLSGTTGNSTGNHLHFQVEENGRAVDPLIYLQDNSDDAKGRKAEGWKIRKAECRKSVRIMNQKIREGFRQAESKEEK